MSETKTIEKTLADLQPGDKVVRRSGMSGRAEVTEVKRITNTQIIIAGAGAGSEIRFRKDNGREIGGSAYYYSLIVVATEEQLKRIELEYRIREVTEFRFKLNGNDKQLINETYEWLLSKGFITKHKDQ